MHHHGYLDGRDRVVLVLVNQRRSRRKHERVEKLVIAEIDGSQGTVWMYIITWIFQIPVIASMAEMASMYAVF